MKISVVIPCYNSANTIGPVVDELIAEIKSKYEYEIILVNDCSPDGGKTWETICFLRDKYPDKIHGINFAKNFGQHAALLAGYRLMDGDVLIQMDDDGQMDPRGISLLIDKLDEGYDVVIAAYPEIKQNLFRRIGSELNRKMSESMLGMPKGLKSSTFLVAKRFVVDEMIKYDKSYPYIGGLLFRTTTNIGNVVIEQRERKTGKSNYSLGGLIKLWMNGFTAFSIKPLRVGTFLGGLLAVSGLIYSLVIIIRRLSGTPYLEGWSSLFALLLIIGGSNLIMLGLVGEYVGRTYICMNNSPQYVVKESF